jgi:DNA uptake protein ComE-like DNA-binding protein
LRKQLSFHKKGYGLRKDGEVRVKPPTAFDKYYATVKDIQSRKEAVESYKLMTEAKNAQQADQRRHLQSRRLNLNIAPKEVLETVLPSFPKETIAQIVQARNVRPFESWTDVSLVHGVGEKFCRI